MDTTVAFNDLRSSLSKISGILKQSSGNETYIISQAHHIIRSTLLLWEQYASNEAICHSIARNPSNIDLVEHNPTTATHKALEVANSAMIVKGRRGGVEVEKTIGEARFLESVVPKDARDVHWTETQSGGRSAGAQSDDTDTVFANLEPIANWENVGAICELEVEHDETGRSNDHTADLIGDDSSENVTTDRLDRRSSSVATLQRGQDLQPGLRDDVRAVVSEPQHTTTTPLGNTTLHLEPGLEPQLLGHMETSGARNVHDMQLDEDGMANAVENNDMHSPLGSETSTERMADDRSFRISGMSLQDCSSEITAESDDGWSIMSGRTSPSVATSDGADNVDKTRSDMSRRSGVPAESDNESNLMSDNIETVHSSPLGPVTDLDVAQSCALQSCASTSAKSIGKNTARKSEGKRKPSAQQLRTNSKKAKTLGRQAIVIPECLMPPFDYTIQPKEIYAKIAARLNKDESDLALMLTRLFYAIGSPQSFYQLMTALASVRKRRDLSGVGSYGGLSNMQALDTMDTNTLVESILRPYFLAKLVTSRDSRQDYHKEHNPQIQPRLLRHGYVKPRAANANRCDARAGKLSFKDLLVEEYPDLRSSAESDTGYKSKAGTLRRRLYNGRHWSALKDKFSVGILALVPTGDIVDISNSRVEHLRNGAFNVLVDVLEAYRGDFLRDAGHSLRRVYDFMLQKHSELECKVGDSVDFRDHPFDSPSLLETCYIE